MDSQDRRGQIKVAMIVEGEEGSDIFWMPAVPRVGDRVEMPDGKSYLVKAVTWHGQTSTITGPEPHWTAWVTLKRRDPKP